MKSPKLALTLGRRELLGVLERLLRLNGESIEVGHVITINDVIVSVA